MGNIPENGYPAYTQVHDTELPNVQAPEKNLPEHSGDDESWKGGPEGKQPGFDIPGVSPMVAGWSGMFGYQKTS